MHALVRGGDMVEEVVNNCVGLHMRHKLSSLQQRNIFSTEDNKRIMAISHASVKRD